jgi:hypothetical protein
MLEILNSLYLLFSLLLKCNLIYLDHDFAGITMRYVEQAGKVHMFAYEHSSGYQAVQRDFLAAVESLNPDNVVAIINAHPYHVDALLQLSELCRMSEDLPMAADLVERAVYALECAFHPLFNLAQGTCRLDYRRQENRYLFTGRIFYSTFSIRKKIYYVKLA